MPRIVSGVPQDTNFPLLQGTQVGREWGAAALERQAENRRQMEALMEFQQEATKVKREEAKLLAEHAQGRRDAKALAAAGATLERMKQNPRFRAKAERGQLAQKAIRRMAERGVSEDTLRRILGQVKDAEKGIQDREEKDAAFAYLDSALADGVIEQQDHALGQAFLQSGGKGSALIQNMHKQRAKRAADAAIMQSNQESLAQVDALIQAMPPGYDKQLALARYHEYSGDSAEQQKEGSGARLAHDIQKISLGSKDDYEAEQLRLQDEKKARLQRMLTGPALGMGGMTGEEMKGDLSSRLWDIGKPNVGELGPDYQHYADQKRSELEARYPGQVGQRVQPAAPPQVMPAAGALTPDAAQAALQHLKAKGLPITKANLLEAQRAFAGGT